MDKRDSDEKFGETYFLSPEILSHAIILFYLCFFVCSTGIERDAVNIYSKYISLDATHPIGITDKLRNEAISKYRINFSLNGPCTSV